MKLLSSKNLFGHLNHDLNWKTNTDAEGDGESQIRHKDASQWEQAPSIKVRVRAKVIILWPAVGTASVPGIPEHSKKKKKLPIKL